MTKLDEYNPGTFSEDPVQSRDLLKKLYHQLFPKSVRHDLGEYYTPDWLAEHVLNELGYEGDPDKRILDPACGSGTFLVMAINRIRRWYDQNREKVPYDEGDLLKKILANVIGFDLNPLAVMAARTNYLVAIKDIVRHVDHVEIPVYLCDSIMTPAEYGNLFTGGAENTAKVPCSAMKPPFLLVPKEIAQSPRDVAKYADILERSIKSGYSPEEFLSRCQDDGLSITATTAHTALYRELVELDKANRNGIWARIIKNNFAPLFVGKVDFVAGNPPWVAYENLPAEYRDSSAKIWQAYKLFPKGGWRARFAKGNTELAMVFTYVSADCYLQPRGRLGFVITQSVFQSKDAGRGFRAFVLGPDRRFRITKVDDFTLMNPFEGAANRTATFSFHLSAQGTQYPIAYIRWRSKKGGFDVGDSLNTANRRSERTELSAWPVDDLLSPWMLLPKGISKETVARVTAGRQLYRAWKGADTRGGNGIFWLEILAGKNDLITVRNMPEFSRKKPPETKWTLEPDLVYPLLRGRETTRWKSTPQYAILFPHEGDRAIAEADLKRRYRRTYEYFKELETFLRKRRMYDLSFRQLAFYSLFETGEFLMAPYKVVWKEIATEVACAVQEPHTMDLIRNRNVIPDHKLVILPCDTEAEAHFVCALLNSAPARFVGRTYIPGAQISTHILEYIKIPRFAPEAKAHADLARLSQKCHVAAKEGDEIAVSSLEQEVDRTAAHLWGLTHSELSAIQGFLNGLSDPDQKSAEAEDE